jgi:hypothetical protein
MRDPELRELYLTTLIEAADSALGPPEPRQNADPATIGWLEAEIDYEYLQIREADRTDPVKNHVPAQFEDGAEKLRAFARQRSDDVRRQVAADREARGIR